MATNIKVNVISFLLNLKTTSNDDSRSLSKAQKSNKCICTVNLSKRIIVSNEYR